MRQRLAGRFDALEQIAAEAGLSSHAREKLAKARRILDAMQATILFFGTMIATWLDAWQLGEPLRPWPTLAEAPCLAPLDHAEVTNVDGAARRPGVS